MDKLEAMLKYVSEHNDFYKKRIAEYGIRNPLDITQWPVLTRKELQENRYNMFSDGYKTKYYDQQLRRQSSSGSSGTPINVYWDTKDYYASIKTLWKKRLQYYNIFPNDKRVIFTLRVFNSKPDSDRVFFINEPQNLLIINVSLLNNDSYVKVIKLIEDFKPKWLYITPYILNKLIETYKEHSIRPPASLEYIESVGEILSCSLRKRVVSFFNVPIANMYGSEEVNGIAYECPYGNMHINTENVFVECFNDDGEYQLGEGEVIVTSITNKAMPLIRYNQSDVIRTIALPKKCFCGCESPIINIIKGRVRERILIKNDLNNDIEINPYLLYETMEEVNNLCSDMVTYYKFIYRNAESLLTCYIALDNKLWFDMVKESIQNTLFLKLDDISKNIFFEVLLVDKPFINKTKEKVLEIIE